MSAPPLVLRFVCPTCQRTFERIAPDDGLCDHPDMVCFGPAGERHGEIHMLRLAIV